MSGVTFDLSPILQAVAGLVAVLIGLLARKIAARQTADAQRSRIESAGLQLAQIVVALSGRAWDRLSPKIQAALADGKVSAEERAAIEAEVKAILEESGGELVSTDTLSQIATALGLPMPGLIARIATGLLDLFVRSHDVTDLSVAPIYAAPDSQFGAASADDRAAIDQSLASGG